ncbi:MAG: PGPGW domain-containing protein [Gammaproteobacteria bacterium]
MNEQLRPVFGEIHRFAVTTYRQAKRLVILLVGGTVLAIGVAMILLPGPAVVVIPLGLAILAVEFAWARRWLVRMREKAQLLRSR